MHLQDEVIARFEARCTEAVAENRSLQAKLQETQKSLQITESRLAEIMDARGQLRCQLDNSHAEFAVMQASLQAELAALKVHTQPACACNLALFQLEHLELSGVH